ncbi:hypothetical protein [Inquilinus limosus]|uniref:Uncharacterized protein n=1 Tax=Inquilinus limosus MP06 TaxID=1398085 RepID=A0A0A0DDC9_9PROT|nr:hypothetical protein [Inquilinus limosus]KGM36134.1 hypothetical protein P409_00365 [Inquilinus limosus MP06]
MKRFPADQNVTLRFDLMVGGEFVVPEIGSVVWSLNGTSTPIGTDATTTFVTVTVPASENAKTDAVEKRTITVSFTYAGFGYSQRQTYLLVDEPPLLVGPDEVRAFLGFSADELADGDIDLLGAYYAVPEEIRTALASADAHILLQANNAVLYRSIMSFSAEALKLRVNQIEKSDQSSFQRFADIDFRALIDTATSAYNDIIDDLVPGDSTGDRSYFLLSTPADVFTGV